VGSRTSLSPLHLHGAEARGPATDMGFPMRLMLVQPHVESCDQPGAGDDPTARSRGSTLTVA
jgi:hypothetical protein